jgi:hypothetical protein
MFQVTDKAGEALNKVLSNPEHQDNHLVIYFQGYG